MLASAVLHVATAAFVVISITYLVGHQPPPVYETAPEIAAAVLTGVAAWRLGARSAQAWDKMPYRVADVPAVRYENKKGHYIKFERYDDGVSANWSTADGPQVLLSVPLRSGIPVGQFWTSEIESDECSLWKLAPDLLQNKSNVIRAWVETNNELIVWRLGDPDSAGVGQLGVLMRAWSPQRVEELVSASATKRVKEAVSKQVRDVGSLMR